MATEMAVLSPGAGGTRSRVSPNFSRLESMQLRSNHEVTLETLSLFIREQAIRLHSTRPYRFTRHLYFNCSDSLPSDCTCIASETK